MTDQNRKKLLIVEASEDITCSETDHIKTVAGLFDMTHETCKFESPQQFNADRKDKPPVDYIYLAAHANPHGFGEPEGTSHSWNDFGLVLCEINAIKSGSILLLACCRGGLRGVATKLFEACTQIDYVCGPRWTVTEQDLTTGFHVFIYNMESRKEQPSCAVERASRATGYDFFCYDRVEMEDQQPSI